MPDSPPHTLRRLFSAAEPMAWLALILAAGAAALCLFLSRGPDWMGAGAASRAPKASARRYVLSADEQLRRLAAPQNGERDAALAAIEQNLRLAVALSDTPANRMRLAGALALQGKTAEADVCRAIAELKGLPATDAASRKQEAERILRALDRAKAAGHRSPDLFIGQYLAAEAADLLYPALRALREFKEQYGETADWHWLNAELAQSEGREEDRLNELRACLKLDPAHRPAVLEFTFSRDTDEGRLEAVRALEVAVQSHGDDAELWHILGRLRVELDNPSDAVEAFDAAFRLAPFSEAVARDLIAALEQSGQSKRAQRLRRQFE